MDIFGIFITDPYNFFPIPFIYFIYLINNPDNTNNIH